MGQHDEESRDGGERGWGVELRGSFSPSLPAAIWPVTPPRPARPLKEKQITHAFGID